MKISNKKWSHLLSVCALISVEAKGGFYSGCYRGFHGYEAIVVRGEKYFVTPKKMRSLLEESFNYAYTNPTVHHVLSYMKLQNMHMRKSTQFARMWEKIVWSYPSLNPDVELPSMHLAHHSLQKRRSRDAEYALTALRGRYALVVCVDNEESSQVMRGVIEQFEHESQWKVLMFGEGELWNGVMDNEEVIRALKVSVFPAFFVLSLESHRFMPIGQSAMSLMELTRRVRGAVYDLGA